jgi:hypothetical protein
MLSLIQQFGDAIIKYGAFFKDQSFMEEQEWRLVSKTISVRELDFRPGEVHDDTVLQKGQFPWAI